MIVELLKRRVAEALTEAFLAGSTAGGDTGRKIESVPLTKGDIESFAALVRPTADPKFGDYQSNCAMPLAKRLGRPPREVAQNLVASLRWQDICLPPEIAGPGFINLRLRDDYLGRCVAQALSDPRLGVEAVEHPLTILIDYSSPNVAKPMHVGHIRSTVIGDALTRTFRFLGHRVITDNHLGDWGTQFGMVIYGFKHFGDEAALSVKPVDELSRLYKLVNRLIGYHEAVKELPLARKGSDAAERAVVDARTAVERAVDGKSRTACEKELAAAMKKRATAQQRVDELSQTIAAAESDPEFLQQASEHRMIADAVLEETARLHAGDPENLSLWERFLPFCRDEIDRIYSRLGIRFDHTLGESFYHDQLGGVIEKLREFSLASDSEGAVCVFLPGFDSPMIVRKKDGAYLYATTDLATLFYRQAEFNPDEILYVVDFRQSDHFQKLFAVAKRLGFSDIRLEHIQFGTVLGPDGRPFKTRSGSSVGLESLLDEAVARALAVVCDPSRVGRSEAPMDEAEQRKIAETVGHGAIKYADLAHHRASDYVFDLDGMVSLNGNTSAYIQYAYARARGIMLKGGYDPSVIASDAQSPTIGEQAERNLAIMLLRFGESLQQVRGDYAPNFLVDYLYDTAKAYAVFNDHCPVLKAGSPEAVRSRLSLVALTARVLETGLDLLGISVIPRM
jgi:arginyl-tRNA synthetase